MATLLVPQKYADARARELALQHANGSTSVTEALPPTKALKLRKSKKTPPVPAPAVNRGSLEENFKLLANCETPDEQKKLIFEMLGDYTSPGKRIEATGNRVLIITHVHQNGKKVTMPDGTTQMIHFIDKRKDANRFEGKTGLVIAIGPAAFKYDGAFKWEGRKPKVGDWVWYRASDAVERGFRSIWGRMIPDDLIEGIVDDPRDVF